MCGITGFAGEGNKADLSAMAETLKHRGPDDEGFYHVPSAVGLGFRRLAIIDLATGNQPISNEDGTVVVVFNGEIYNYRALRSELAEKHSLSTAGDTEVIVHLYEDEGERVFERLNGMFAIAIWDAKSNTLLLARDRYGEKPLYYSVIGETIVFGSELKALLRHPLVKSELDINALDRYLSFEYVPSPQSIFKNIQKLEPGTYLRWSHGVATVERYYEPQFAGTRANDVGLDESVTTLEKKIRRSVSERLVSDVPLGLFLSGGLDSSTICYYARELLPGRVKTFSIGFDDASFDESDYAREVAELLGTDHYMRRLGAFELTDTLPSLLSLLDEPISDPAIIPNYLLARFAREQVTVVLGGDGGDELFLGYPTFQAHVIAPYVEKIPQSIRSKILRPLIESLPTSFGHVPLDYRLKRFLLGLEYPPRSRDLIWIGSFTPEEKVSLLTADALEAIRAGGTEELIPPYPRSISDKSELSQAAYFYLRYYLGDGVLTIKDRASMYASLELRSPLLDMELVDYANSLPHDLKRRGFTTKFLLKKLMEDKLPNRIVYRKKKGFGVPIARWLAGDLAPYMRDVLSKRTITNDGIFRFEEVERLMNEHVAGKRDHRKRLWTLLVFQIWKNKWLT